MTLVEQEVAPEVLTERERRARVLEAAALEIEVRGWCRGQTEDENGAGNVCLVGAVGRVLGVHLAYPETGRVWFGRETEIADTRQLWKFNDDTGRTADEVTFVLRWRAAEIRDGL